MSDYPRATQSYKSENKPNDRKEHIFLALPDPSAPSTQEDVAGWIAKQEVKKLKTYQ